jgi:sensor histidine kinase YesM
MLQDKNTAALMVERLQKFFELTFHFSDQHLVPLRQELEFLRCYLDIQQIRFKDRLAIHLDVDPAVLRLKVPQLILQPLVENAIRHGVSNESIQGEIRLKAQRNNGRLLLVVEDNGPGRISDSTFSYSQSGIGLHNTSLRLQGLYGASHEFECGNREQGGFSVRLGIPVQDTAETGLK